MMTMTTEMNTRKEMLENELEMANGGADWGHFFYVMFCGEDEDDNKSLVLPQLDVDNRPAIDFRFHGPAVREK